MTVVAPRKFDVLFDRAHRVQFVIKTKVMYEPEIQLCTTQQSQQLQQFQCSAASNQSIYLLKFTR